MRSGIIVATIVLLAAVSRPGAVAAEPVSPGGGSAFGQHVMGLTPEHPLDHGQMFGECVSTMVTTGTCPHHQ